MEGINNLTKGNIRKQLISLSLPLITTSFIMMTYNLTDIAWVGRIGSKAVAAVGACGIIHWIIDSLSLLTKVSSEVTVGNSVGCQNISKAKEYASQNITVSFFMGMLLMFFVISFAENIVSIFLLEDDVSEMAISYLRIVSISIPFYMMTTTMVGVFNGAGNTKTPLYINATGLILNMILDPLFIIYLDFGTDGAAWATMISKIVVFILFTYIIKCKKVLFNNIKFITKLNLSMTSRIIKLGGPVALLNMVYSTINMFLSRIASSHGGHLALQALTTGGQLESLSWYSSQGLSSALSSFVAQNSAVKKYDRVGKSFNFATVISLVIGIFTTIAFVYFGEELFAIFVPEQAAYKSGADYLRISGYSQVMMMFEIVAQGLFYGLNRSVPPAIISISFNCMRIPAAFYLANMFGVDGIWWAIALTSIAKGIISLICTYRIFSRFKK